ncbi:MAG: RNA recognition motif domain-containing protein [Panacagrimonas sp.]
MLRIYAGNLPPDTNEKEITELFSAHGKVRSIKLMHDVFSGKCKGFGFLEMEGHEARAAIAGLNGKELRGNLIRVNEERKDEKNGKGGRYAGGRR